jgi:hypothetical protein
MDTDSENTRELPPDSPFSSATKGDVILQSSDGLHFYVHRSILTESSAVFADMVSIPHPSDEKDTLIPMSEDSITLDLVLRYIYPIPNPIISKFEQLQDVLRAADKYFMESVKEAVRAALISERFLAKNPVRVYLTACQYMFVDEAQRASRRALQDGIKTATPDVWMAEGCALAYGKLVRLFERRTERAIDILQSYIPQDHRQVCIECEHRRFRLSEIGRDIRRQAVKRERQGTFRHERASWEERFQTQIEELGDMEDQMVMDTAVAIKTFDKDVLPIWWEHFLSRAKSRLRKFPSSRDICSMEFVAESIRESQCITCWSLLQHWMRDLTELQKRIDGLPDTVSIPIR